MTTTTTKTFQVKRVYKKMNEDERTEVLSEATTEKDAMRIALQKASDMTPPLGTSFCQYYLDNNIERDRIFVTDSSSQSVIDYTLIADRENNIRRIQKMQSINSDCVLVDLLDIRDWRLSHLTTEIINRAQHTLGRKSDISVKVSGRGLIGFDNYDSYQYGRTELGNDYSFRLEIKARHASAYSYHVGRLIGYDVRVEHTSWQRRGSNIRRSVTITLGADVDACVKKLTKKITEVQEYAAADANYIARVKNRKQTLRELALQAFPNTNVDSYQTQFNERYAELYLEEQGVCVHVLLVDGSIVVTGVTIKDDAKYMTVERTKQLLTSLV